MKPKSVTPKTNADSIIQCSATDLHFNDGTLIGGK
jgi:hypothetical protein